MDQDEARRTWLKRQISYWRDTESVNRSFVEEMTKGQWTFKSQVHGYPWEDETELVRKDCEEKARDAGEYAAKLEKELADLG